MGVAKHGCGCLRKSCTVETYQMKQWRNSCNEIVKRSNAVN